MVGFEVGAEHEVTVEKLVYGGEGLARLEGRVLLVPRVAAGERVRVRITAVQRRVLRAELLEVLRASPARREPPCVHFGQCGGCQLQHLAYPAQLEAKRAFVREALERLGGVVLPAELELCSGPEFGYRTRAELVGGADTRVGYRRRGSHEVVAVQSCPVLVPELQEGLAALRAAPGVEIVHTARNGGAPEQPLSGIRYRAEGGAFFQGNRWLLGELLQLAVGDAQGRLALDLFSGVGFFALALARRFERVHAFEGHTRALELARANAQANGLGNLSFHAGDVAQLLSRPSPAWSKPDLVLLDPPRAGAGPGLVAAIAALAPREVRYVSCDPTTLARDLKAFAAAGYALGEVVALDLFPQTYHVEVLARLRPSG